MGDSGSFRQVLVIQIVDELQIEWLLTILCCHAYIGYEMNDI